MDEKRRERKLKDKASEHIEMSDDDEICVEQNGKWNTIWNIVMKGKSREEASEAELKVMEEIESLISKQPEV